MAVSIHGSWWTRTKLRTPAHKMPFLKHSKLNIPPPCDAPLLLDAPSGVLKYVIVHQKSWHFSTGVNEKQRNQLSLDFFSLFWVTWKHGNKLLLIKINLLITLSKGHFHSGWNHSTVLPLLVHVYAGRAGDTVCHLSGHSFLHHHHHSSGPGLLLCTGKLTK